MPAFIPQEITKHKKRDVYRIDLRKYGGGQPTAKTLAEARKILEHTQERLADETFIDNSKQKDFDTLVGAAEKFGSFLHAENRRVPSEISPNYFHALENYLNQAADMLIDKTRVGNIPVHQLTSGDIQHHLVPQIFEGRANKTGRHMYSAFSRALRFGVVQGTLKYNPCGSLGERLIRLPKKTKRKAKRISQAAIAAIIENGEQASLRGHNQNLQMSGEPFDLIMEFAAWTGLRRGEQVALTWDDIQFADNFVRVNKAQKKDGDVGSPKTEAGNRLVPLVADLKARLLAWKEQQPLRQRKQNLVFPYVDGGYPPINRWRKVGLFPAIKKAGLQDELRDGDYKMNWHDLRHFYASVLLFDLQWTDSVIATVMGHSSIMLTRDVYGHWMKSARRDTELAGALQNIKQGVSQNG